MGRKISIVNQAIIDAGGQAAVGRALSVSQPQVFRWTEKGMPNSDKLKRTTYSKTIAKMANARNKKSDCEETRSRRYTSEQLAWADHEGDPQ